MRDPFLSHGSSPQLESTPSPQLSRGGCEDLWPFRAPQPQSQHLTTEKMETFLLENLRLDLFPLPGTEGSMSARKGSAEVALHVSDSCFNELILIDEIRLREEMCSHLPQVPG